MARSLRLISYFGTKGTLAGFYPEPIHETIIEPFAGSAAYSLYGENWRKNVILIDKYDRLIAAWRYLKGATKKDILKLPVPDVGVNLDELRLSESEKNFLGFWICIPTTGPRKTTTDRTHWTESAREMVAENVGKIRHWKIVEGDYTQAPDRTATWFVDPPYQRRFMGGNYIKNQIDFAALGEWCKSRKGQLIVCEGSGADWLPFDHFRTQRTTTRGHYNRTGRREKIFYRPATDARSGFDRKRDGGPAWLQFADDDKSIISNFPIAIPGTLGDRWAGIISDWKRWVNRTPDAIPNDLDPLEILETASEFINDPDSGQKIDLITGFDPETLDSLLINVARFNKVFSPAVEILEVLDDLALFDLHASIHKLSEVVGESDDLGEEHNEVVEEMDRRQIAHDSDLSSGGGDNYQDEDPTETESELERVAAAVHESWSGWMRHLFSKGTDAPDGAFIIDPESVARWRRQMNSGYYDLPIEERRSDLIEAEKYLSVVGRGNEPNFEASAGKNESTESDEYDPAEDPKVGPRIFPYFGSKARLIYYYPRPVYETIIEPFAGSATFSLYGDNPEKNVILIDKDPAVCELWRWLIKCRPSEILKIPICKKGQNIDDLNITENQRRFLARFTNTNGKENKTFTEYGITNWTEKTRARSADLASRIKHWKVVEGDYSDAPERAATWFIDPPYRREDQGSFYKKSNSEINFSELADWIKSRRGQVIVCGSSGCDYLDFENIQKVRGSLNRNYFEKIWYRPDTNKRPGFDPEIDTPWIYASDETPTVKFGPGSTIDPVPDVEVDASKYLPFYAVLQAHFRGRSVHTDFRVKRPDGKLEGWTLDDGIAGGLKNPVLKSDDAESLIKNFGRKIFGFFPGMRSVRAEQKSEHSAEWLNAGGEIIEPGEAGATAKLPGVVVDRARGWAYFGARRPDFYEYFLEMQNGFIGRLIVRSIAKTWLAFMTAESPEKTTPYILQPDSEYIPDSGERAIPPSWEKKIPPEFAWWNPGLSPGERRRRVEGAKEFFKSRAAGDAAV